MPEGDTIHTLAGALRPRLVGQTLADGSLREAPGVSLAGLRVSSVTAQGKHLLIDFTDGTRLRSHLGMHGSWHRYCEGEEWRRPPHQASVVLRTGTQVFVCFNAREVAFGPRHSLTQRDALGRLGPDLAGERVDFDAVLQRAGRLAAEHPDALVVDLLLDQTVAAGIGNVYKSELLFLAGLHPRTRARDVEVTRVRALYRRAQELLRANLGGGPRVTRAARGARDGELWVYRRAERPCHACDTPITSARLGRGWRSTYWCPRCQRAGGREFDAVGAPPPRPPK